MSVIERVREEWLARERAFAESLALAAVTAGVLVVAFGVPMAALALLGHPWLLSPQVFALLVVVGGAVGWVAASRSVLRPPEIDREREARI